MEATKLGMDFSDLNVLVVDDESSITKLVKMTLADLDVSQVYTAKDGREAIVARRTGRYRHRHL